MSRMWSQDEIDDDIANGDDEDDEMESLAQACGLYTNGQCSMAGTEHCDFECPWRDSEDFAGSGAWLKKHNKEAR